MPHTMARLWAFTEYAGVTLAGRCFGVGVVVRYLRNPNPRVTVKLLRAFGARVGDRTRFKRAVHLDNAFEDQNATGDLSHLRVGANCYIGDGVYFDLANAVELEDDVVVSGRVAFITHADCNRSPMAAQSFPRQCRPIRVRRGAWLAFGVTVLDGVTVGENAVVAAHALLRDDAAPATLYAGTPARVLRPLSDQYQVSLGLMGDGR